MRRNSIGCCDRRVWRVRIELIDEGSLAGGLLGYPIAAIRARRPTVLLLRCAVPRSVAREAIMSRRIGYSGATWPRWATDWRS